MSDTDEKDTSSKAIAIWTALITATATVLTAFIGIVPQMRKGDQQTMQAFQQRINQLQAKLDQKHEENAYTLKGSVKYNKGNTPVAAAILLAGPAADITALDDEGSFSLSNVADRAYFVAVQTEDGKIQRVLLDPQNPATQTPDFAITYAFSAPPTPPASGQ
jgi:hypothetical protein